MKKSSFPYATTIVLVISVTLCIYTRVSKIEELSLIDLLFFLTSALCISSSLSLLIRSSVDNKGLKIALLPLLGVTSAVSYYVLFFCAFQTMQSGEAGMIFGGLFGVLGSMLVGIIGMIVSAYKMFI